MAGSSSMIRIRCSLRAALLMVKSTVPKSRRWTVSTHLDRSVAIVVEEQANPWSKMLLWHLSNRVERLFLLFAIHGIARRQRRLGSSCLPRRIRKQLTYHCQYREHRLATL